MQPKPSPTRQRGPNGRFTARDVAARGSTIEPTQEAEPEPALVASPSLQLFLLRHADAGDASLWSGVDADRPLSKKGRRQAKALARALKDLGLRVDAVITSPFVRAAQTARPVAKALGVDVLTDERLGYDFGKRQLAALIGQLPPSITRLVLVGHDPGFTEVASLLVGAPIPMAKGTLARIDLAEREIRAGELVVPRGSF